MAGGDTLAEKADALLADLFSSWNTSTTIFAVFVFIYLVYPLLSWKDPDLHPFLLARQAGASPIRQNGESPVYRAIEIPYGYPLRAGLGVKDPGAPKWSGGRDGDLRDIWRRAVQGPIKEDGTSAGPKGRVITVLGREKVLEHSLGDLTRGINAVGKHIKDSGAKKVAICLPNSIELLQGLFAASFYGSSSTLIPYGLPQSEVAGLIAKASSDLLIAEAGVLELMPTVSSCPSLRHIIWVTKGGSEHMDWNEVPEGMRGKLGLAVWKDLADDKSVSSEVLPVDKESQVESLSTFWPVATGGFELVEYTSKNIIAAVAALNSALPRNHRLSPDDLVLPLTPLWLSYPLCTTLAALFANASIALNTVAGDAVDVELASEGISPTFIVCSTRTALDLHVKTSILNSGIFAGIGKSSQKRSLKAGVMPASKPSTLSASPLSKLRLLLVSHRAADPSSPTLSSSILSDLRMHLGARVVYALTTGKVAGAINQSNALDYREKGVESHFGPPLSSVEVVLVGEEDSMAGAAPSGFIVIRGPAVVGGEARLETLASFDDDNTLMLT